MDKQKAQLKKLLTELGYSAEDADALVVATFSDEATELPITEIILKAQEHFKPVIKTSLKKELSHEFKGQYMGEALNKVIAASKGKLKRPDYDSKTIEEALSDLVSAHSAPPEQNDELTQKYNEAVARISALEAEKETAVASVRSEYEEKENGRMVFDSVLAKLGAIQNPGEGKVGKKLTVEQSHAAKAILRELSDEYTLKYNADGKSIGVYSKANPGELVVKDGKLLDVDSLLMDSLTRNNWVAKSNGSENPQGGLQHFNIGSPKSREGQPNDVTELSSQVRDSLSKHLPAA